MLKRDFAFCALVLASYAAHAQLTTVDGGAAVADSSGLMFATTIGNKLSWLPGTGPETTAQWVANLNAENYGGYSDWTVATGVGTEVPNTTTNQLAQLFLTDCGNAAGSALGCASFSALNTIFQNGDGYHAPGTALFFSSSLYSATCCDIYSTYWWAYGSTQTMSYPLAYNYDSDFQGGGLEHADAIAVRVAWAPEIDASTAFGALLLLGGSLAVAIDRKRMA
jgi:hypothetical protein